MTEMLPFGRWLRQLRAEYDLTQEALAERVGCAVQTIRTFERGLRRPSRDMAERLADVLLIAPAQRGAFLHAARSPLEARHAEGLADAPSAEPLAAVTPAGPTRQPHEHIPMSSTVLIGREAERRVIHTQLAAPSGRLITLVGPGGIGKTQLALQVAADLARGDEGVLFDDGVVFVGLAPIADAANVVAAIAEALGCALPGTVAPESHLLTFLRERSLLLLLDNLEHLIGNGQGERVIGLIAAIARHAPGVRLLVTSRERLRLREERVIELAGLALPDERAEAIERSDAVLLFLERARQAAGDFALGPDNRAAVARICRLLDGAPLAIELAAVWVRALACDEIAEEIARGLDFLALSDRDVDPRHRSMRAVFDHSWDLLAEDERRVLARLSVFHGGCRREAAEAVAGATLPVLIALIDKSLLRRTAAGRYELHELLRQFAQAKLDSSPEDGRDARERHCAYFIAWLQARSSALKSPQQYLVVAEIVADIDNIRAARQHAIDRRLVESIWQMEQANVLLWFYELRSWYQESEEVCRRTVEVLRALPLTTPREQALLANQIGCQGWSTFRCGRPLEGRALLEESLARLRALDHPFYLFTTLLQLSFIAFISGDTDFALAQEAEVEALARQIGDPWSLAQMYYQRAMVYSERVPELAYARFHEGMPYLRSLGDRYLLGLSLFHLGTVALGLGRVNEAERSFAEALDYSREVGNGVTEVAALNGLAMLACARADWPAAIERCRAALLRAGEVGDPWSRLSALVTLGEAEAGNGEYAAARATLLAAIADSLAAHVLPTAIDAWIRLAQLDAQGDGRGESLLTILAVVRSHPAAGRLAVARARQLWQALEHQAGPHALAAAEQMAARLSPDDLGALISAYAAGRPAGILATLGELKIENEELSKVATQAHAPFSILNSQLPDPLTERELDVLRLLAAGRSNQQIADELVLAIGTVKRHVNSILSKLQVESRLAAVARARQLNLVA
jgi:predicted ATPase/DNA-binding CsgD family transcriptional regulator/transcriptional regulator with XRE-family HTH domain